MKKLIAISAMAVFLSSMATQAQSTISWDFDTPGDTEGWHPTGHTSLSNGIIVTNGIDDVVLTSPGITGGDPGIQTTNTTVVPVGEYWDTVEVRVRTTSGSFPAALAEGHMLFIVGGEVTFSGWSRVDGTNQWAVLSLDITTQGTNDISYIRVDPPALSPQNFEFDYVRLTTTTNAPPPPVYKVAWEFNTPGDTEGWKTVRMGGVAEIATESGGTESVLTTTDASGSDPVVINELEPATHAPGLYWTTAEIRIRHTLGGVGQVWDPAGTLFLLNNQVLSTDSGNPGKGIGGSDWDTTTEANGWIVTRFDISGLSGDFFNMRIDPFDPANGRTFEIDYVRFNTRSTPPLPPAPGEWEFNTPGDTELITIRSGINGLTAATAITGSEGVLTSSDITILDPWLFYNDGNANAALRLTPPAPWTTVEIRIRHLDGNPGDLGVASTNFAGGTRFQINPWSAGNAIITPTVALGPDNWQVMTYDISALGLGDLDALRFDPLENDDTINFEIDWIRAYTQGSKYDAWSQVLYLLEGTNALTTSDYDEDGVNNLYEFAFGGNPTNPADVGFVESSIVNDGGTSYVEYNYARRTDSNTGLTYTFEQRDDLGVATPWVDLAGAAEVGTQAVGDDHEVVTNRVDTTSDTELFHRVEVSIDQ